MRLPKQVELVSKLLQAGDKPKLSRSLQRLGPYVSSQIVRELETPDRCRLVAAMAAEPFLLSIFNHLADNLLFEIFASLPPEQVFDLLTRMPPHICWGYLKQLPIGEQEELLAKLPAEQAEAIRKISLYPKESCGEIMDTELLYVHNFATVDEALKVVRNARSTAKIFYLYVVDAEKHLLGTVPLRALIREDPKSKVSEAMVENPVAVQTLDPQKAAAQLVSRHKLLAVPVVDESHHLMGVIRVDDVIDIVEEEATDEMFHLAGLTPEDRVFAPLWQTTRKRLIWMFLNLATAFLAAWVVGLFQESIAKVVALAIFMPVVAGMGGNGGTQSLTVMTRALAMGEIGRHEVKRVLAKQILVGLLIGLITGAVTGLVSWAWQGNLYLGLVLWCAMVVNMMIAGFAGGFVPIFLRFLKLDPAIGSSVLVTTFTDVFGFLAFLGLATVFLKYLV